MIPKLKCLREMRAKTAWEKRSHVVQRGELWGSFLEDPEICRSKKMPRSGTQGSWNVERNRGNNSVAEEVRGNRGNNSVAGKVKGKRGNNSVAEEKTKVIGRCTGTEIWGRKWNRGSKKLTKDRTIYFVRCKLLRKYMASVMISVEYSRPIHQG